MEKWALKYLSQSDCAKISEAIRFNELKTSGEIVIMLVKKSSSTTHLPLLLTLFCTVLFLYLEIPQIIHKNLFWFQWLSPICILLFYGISHFLAKSLLLQRFLIAKNERAEQVFYRAQREFYSSGVNKTKRSTAILIFISLMERQVVLLADESINSKIPQSTWQQGIQIIINSIKNHQLENGLIETTHLVGDLLAFHFPQLKEDENEISNDIIIKN